MNAHHFPAGAACVWCKASPEMVADRRAPPYCPERPDDMREDARGDADRYGGY